MATQARATGAGLAPYRLTAKQFSKMINSNILIEGDRVELLGGILFQMTTNVPHEFIVGRLASRLRPLLPMSWSLREEKSIRLGRRWRPYPDIAILRTTDDTFAHRAPQPRDIALLVEVSDTTYPKDSGLKLRRYAHAGVPLYWIVHVERRQVEVYRQPHGRHSKAYYRLVEIYPEDSELPVVIDGQDLGRIAVKDILP